ncbi:MAG TPA: acetylxylan esterase [Flavitalea sp.]|nr:acetylxylan esterase [Flavitalea sp.]
MKSLGLLFLSSFIFICSLNAATDSIPRVLPAERQDLVLSRLRYEAELKFASHRLPSNPDDWKTYREKLRKEIIKKTGTQINHQLPLDITYLGELKMKGYTIKNIIFQTRPGAYATANLFVPDGKGPFPAVINMHAHSGRFDDDDQGVGHSLAVNGYVCLSIDPWGAGERTTIHGKEEYHGSNLGASFMNIGESLMGVQITDNVRGVDLLVSLPFVDAKNIGAAGASGGGNQTMWLAAVDDRVKASAPVVSVGTFESYVMRDNCICETLVDGLSFTEEAGVLALTAPGAVQICNHLQDKAPAFFPSEMLRSYNNALPVFRMLGVEKNIDYKLFDLPHGYVAEDREAMLGWFDLHLKGVGDGSPKKEAPFEILHEGELMIFPVGKRDPRVITTEIYCKRRGQELREAMLNAKAVNAAQKRKSLLEALRVSEMPSIKQARRYSSENGWDRIALETSDGKLIPVLVQKPSQPAAGYTIVSHPKGKHNTPQAIIEELKQKGSGIVLVDLTGIGEVASKRADRQDEDASFHTVSRAEIWLGKTTLGEWTKELHTVSSFLGSEYKAQKIRLDGSAETGIASLFLAAVAAGGPSTMPGARGNLPVIESVTVRDAPISYLFDQRETINHFTMAIHVPGFLNWGDVSLASALAGKNITFINPLSMSGRPISGNELDQYKNEFQKMIRLSGQKGTVQFK